MENLEQYDLLTKSVKLRISHTVKKYKGDPLKMCGVVDDDLLLNIIKFGNIDLTSHDDFLLKWSIINNKLEVVKELLKTQNINLFSSNYFAIRKSIERKSNDIAKLLLSDPRINISHSNNTLFMTAIIYNNQEIIDEIMKHPNFDIKISLDRILYAACDKSNLGIIKYIIDNDYEVSRSTYSDMFIRACRMGDLPMMKILLTTKRINISHDNNCAFFYGLSKNNDEIIDFILNDDRLDPTTNNYNLIATILEFKRFDVLERLLKHKNILRGDINTLIYCLVRQPKFIRMLILEYNLIGKLTKGNINYLNNHNILPNYKPKKIVRTLN